MKRAFIIICALALPAVADEVKKSDTTETSGPTDIPRSRYLGADTTPTRAGALEGGSTSIAFSSDGTLLAQAAPTGAVSVARIADSDESSGLWHRVAEHLGAAAGVAFLPKNPLTLVSVGDDETIRTATLDASLAIVTSASRQLGLGPLTALAVLDASHVAVGSCRGQIAIVKLEDAITVEKTFERHEGSVAALVALDKNRLASAGWDGCVKISDLGGREIKSAKVSAVELTTLAATPDGKSLAAGSWKKGVVLLDASSLKTLATLEPHRGCASAVLLVGPARASLAQCRLVSASLSDETLAASDTLGAKAELGHIRRTRIKTVPSGGLAVSPDLALIACATNDGAISLYKLERK